MRILILGSGVLGVTTAYELGKRGHQVTVIDRCTGSGMETSYANGGQLSYTHAEPWAAPAILHKLPKWLLHPDAPLVFRPRADRAMISWIVRFLRNCTPARAHEHCVHLLRLGLYSRECMAALVADTGIAFDYAAKGIVHIFTTPQDLEHARRQYAFQAKFGCESRLLSAEETLALEPSLRHSARRIVGGLHAMQDEIGDAYLFCVELAKLAAQRYNVQFQYGVTVKGLRKESKTIAAVLTDQGDICADAYVMALGAYSPLYLAPLGMHIPIYPMKGYSLTIPANENCPQASITDGSHKIVYTRLGKALRISGTAEFAGYDASINPRRTAPMLKAARQLFPQADWHQEIESWACLRPSTPDGPPIMGATPYRNLFLNTGHGTLGWTQAPGSAIFVADAMEGKTPGILPQGLTMERYG